MGDSGFSHVILKCWLYSGILPDLMYLSVSPHAKQSQTVQILDIPGLHNHCSVETSTVTCMEDNQMLPLDSMSQVFCCIYICDYYFCSYKFHRRLNLWAFHPGCHSEVSTLHSICENFWAKFDTCPEHKNVIGMKKFWDIVQPVWIVNYVQPMMFFRLYNVTGWQLFNLLQPKKFGKVFYSLLLSHPSCLPSYNVEFYLIIEKTSGFLWPGSHNLIITDRKR